MKKKLLALFLCCALSFGLVTAALITPAAAESDFMIHQDGTPVTTVELPEYNSVTVDALLAQTLSGNFQWQIMARGVWANIVGATDNSLTLRYAMLANVLNGDGQATVRCRFTPVDGEVMYSNTLTVQMTSGDVATTIPVDDVDFKFTVTDPGSVVEHETAAPAPTEEPAPTEDVIAAEDVTDSADETIPAEEPQAEDNDAAPANDTPVNDTPDVKQTYNVVVNYLFENNEVVSEPYTATLAEGSPFSATVTFPTVLGYLPYVEDVRQDSIDLHYESISENVTINVVYKPTNVDYTVIHYLQNIDNDDYTEIERETKQGLTKSQVPEVAKSYEGFYSLIYERPAIAADGSTVIEIYYDRYYYLMLFDMDGGYGTDPIYVRYGAALGTVNDPTKAGYSFGGWALTKDGAKVDLPTTMPAENRTYYALWTPDATAKVTIVFWGENADDENYSYLDGYNKVINLQPGTKIQYDGTNILTCGYHNHDAKCYKLTCTEVPHNHNSCTLNCTHTHTLDCYSVNRGSLQLDNNHGGKTEVEMTNLGNGLFSYTTGWNGGNSHYYVKIGDNWYCSSNGNSNRITFSCTHTSHDDSCYTCGMIANSHVHTSDCYTLDCDKPTHTHNSGCYTRLDSGLSSTLWKFAKSDETTVAADGSTVLNVYFDRTEFTLTFKADGSTVATITAKWGADISGEFSKAPFNTTYSGRAWLCTDKDLYAYALQTLDRMPKFDATFNLYRQSSYDKKTIYYYVQKVGTTANANQWPTNNANFDLLKQVDTYFNFATYDEEYHEIQGFTRYSVQVSGFTQGTNTRKDFSGNRLDLYYMRNSYTLTFNNQQKDVDSKSVQYEAPLGTYASYVPAEIPSWYEPGSVKFDGWYQNPLCTGDEYILNDHTMPAGDLILYAKWTPITHTVNFYLTEQDKDVYTPNGDAPASFTVDHAGNIAKQYVDAHLTKEAMNEAKPNGKYKFVVWYYYENGVKKYFDPTMQVRTDLDLYAEWTSNTLMQYTVQFVLQNDPTVKVADDITGSGLAGTTKTFNAKGGTELYTTYQEGYFPDAKSKSLTLDIDSNELVITFYYVPVTAIPYTVKYINKETGTSVFDGETVADKVVSDNRKAVITETFKVIPGYMPDAYQKRLVVTSDGENILYFYYTKDEAHAYYKITHYTQNTDGETWTVYAESQAPGDIGATYTAESMNIPGFTLDETVAETVKSGKLTADGLELKLYYVRNPYPYQVRYLEQGTGNVLHDPKNGTGLYGKMVSESAIDIDGYDKVDPTTVSISIRIETDDTAKLNIITFYYTEKTVEIKYVPVGPAGATNFGSVAPTSETVKVKSGTAVGSTPTPGTGFKFVGWYKDEACTQPVEGEGWLVGNVIRPQKGEDGKNTAETYYAKFEYDVADLTITKTGCEDIDAGQSFIFMVTDINGNFIQNVVINGNGSVTIKGLTIGTYVVTEDTGWSWRYTPEGGNVKSITLDPTGKNNVGFTNKRTNDKWLDGNAYVKNVFGTITETVSGN